MVLNAQNAISVDTISTPSLKIQPLYNQTPPKIWKLIHTQLELSFNYQKEEVNGMAVLTLRPYFYRQNSLTLDAKSFDFQSILLIEPDSSARKLTYE